VPDITRVLVFSTLYPNTAQPNHGIFVENRLRHTLALGGISASVLAPVPYFPSSHPMFGRYAPFAQVPEHEVRHGIDVAHPRYLVIPRLSRFTPYFLYRTALRAVRSMQQQGQRFDVIDAHYFYPDGVAAAWLSRKLEIPLVITGRGTDLTLIPKDTNARRKIQGAMEQSSAMITVCEDLRQHLLRLGAREDRTLTLRNGVDLQQFTPGDRKAARQQFASSRFTWLSVGSLIPRKGHHITIEALARSLDCNLLIAGSGPLRAELELLAGRLGVGHRVRFLGDVPHAALPGVYRAADVMVLASEREGWANVLLEAMACGTPVIATNINGTAEVVRAPAAGRLMTARTPEALLAALSELRRNMPSFQETRAYAELFSWSQTANANKALLTDIAAAGYAGRYNQGLTDAARACIAG
jgi:glycosyltransferase involved in cell wall biosynthesis